MRRLKYWFLLPLLVTGGTTAWSYLSGNAGEEDWFFFPLILTGAALSWWVSDTCGVKGAHREWEKLRRALDDGEVG